jgi:flagellar protein FlbD
MDPMILLRRLGGPVFALNPDLIERAEATPDTVVTMVGGNKYLVCETLEELVDAIREHRAHIIATAESAAIDNGSRSEATHARLHEVSHVTSSVIPLRSKDI